MRDRPMTIVEHLEELRRRLLLAFAALGVGSVVGFLFVDRVLDFLIRMMGVERVVFFAPAEALFIRLKIAVFIGVFVGLPVILYQLWAFVAVGLTQTERQHAMLLPSAPSSRSSSPLRSGLDSCFRFRSSSSSSRGWGWSHRPRWPAHGGTPSSPSSSWRPC
jgi:hypothetical protein